MWTLVGEHWTLQRVCASSGIVDQLGYSASRLILEVGCGEDTFSPDPAWLVFWCPSSHIAGVIIPCDDRHPQNGAKVVPNITETRVK